MKKILIIDNGEKDFKREIIQPFISLTNETDHDQYKIDIIQDYFPFINDGLSKNDYDYLIFQRCIGKDYYNTCGWLRAHKILRQHGDGKIKFINYINKFWYLPKDHPLFEKYNSYRIGEQIKEVISMSDFVISYSSEIINEVIKTTTYHTKETAILFDNLYFHKDTDVNYKHPCKLPIVGIVPSDIYDIQNIKQLNGIHKSISKPGFWNTFKIVLVGFNPSGITTEINKYTHEITEISTNPRDSIYVKYEKIITDNYNICSPEYKEFLLKYLPNHKYNGDIDKENYKRVWYNEVDDNILEYNILLQPLIKNKYNQLNFSYERERAKRTLTQFGKYIQVIRTDILPKNKKSIMRSIQNSLMEYRQTPIFEDKPYENNFIDNLKFML
jgi:hypothetical protein